MFILDGGNLDLRVKACELSCLVVGACMVSVAGFAHGLAIACCFVGELVIGREISEFTSGRYRKCPKETRNLALCSFESAWQLPSPEPKISSHLRNSSCLTSVPPHEYSLLYQTQLERYYA